VEKKREVLRVLSREKKIHLQERIYNDHVRLSSPEPWLVGSTKACSGPGADIVMESISLRNSHGVIVVSLRACKWGSVAADEVAVSIAASSAFQIRAEAEAI